MCRLLKIQAGVQLVSSLASQSKYAECEVACLAAIEEVEREPFADSFKVHIAPLQQNLEATMEGLTWFKGDIPELKTNLGTWKTLATATIRDAEAASENQLSDETIELITRMKIELDEPTVTDLLEHLHSIDTGNTNGQSQLVEAIAFGLLAKNASELESEKGRQNADAFLKHAIESIEEVVALTTAGAVTERILTEPKLEWVRSTDTFREAWKQIVPARKK